MRSATACAAAPASSATSATRTPARTGSAGWCTRWRTGTGTACSSPAFLAENGVLVEPESGAAMSLDECREIALEEGVDTWVYAGRCATTMLPEIFQERDPVLDVALPRETRQELEKLLDSLPPDVFRATDSLGWTYQFWQSARKHEINSSGVKIGPDELPAVTQLFTERYMVLFLLHNTIGAWRAGQVLESAARLGREARSEADLRKATRVEAGSGYDFSYLRFVRNSPDGSGEAEETGDHTGNNETARLPSACRPAAGTFAKWPRRAADLRILDPCCGSGHFLVEALRLMVPLRMEEEGVATEEAIFNVLRDNLFGLEIDPRCTQIAAFNLALAAWQMAGDHIDLPPLNIACSGLAPNLSETAWMRLADRVEDSINLSHPPDLFGREPSLATGPVQSGMQALYRLFRQAPTLGSLIEPDRVGGDFFTADFATLRDGLTRVLRREAEADQRDEGTVAAAGMALAADILAGEYTLVATNVPFLARRKQAAELKRFAETHHGDAKGDIANVFVSRAFGWLGEGGTQAVVTPQNWLFLKSYRKLRQKLLKKRTWNVVARLGPAAFETIGGHVVNVSLNILSARRPSDGWEMAGVDVSSPQGERPIRAAEKAELLGGEAEVVMSRQAEQTANPDSRILLEPLQDHPLLSTIADYGKGSTTGDRPRFLFPYWELPRPPVDSVPWLDSPDPDHRSLWTGRKLLLKIPLNDPELNSMPGCRLHGQTLFGRDGIAVRKTGTITPYAYGGQVFDDKRRRVGSKGRILCLGDPELLRVRRAPEDASHSRPCAQDHRRHPRQSPLRPRSLAENRRREVPQRPPRALHRRPDSVDLPRRSMHVGRMERSREAHRLRVTPHRRHCPPGGRRPPPRLPVARGARSGHTPGSGAARARRRLRDLRGVRRRRWNCLPHAGPRRDRGGAASPGTPLRGLRRRVVQRH